MPAILRARLPLAAALVGSALLAGPGHGQEASLTVSAIVVGQCTLTGATLDFGAYVAGQSSARNGQSSIGIDCPAGVDVTIDMSPGGNPGPGGFRNMAGGDDFLRYQLYRNGARTQVWSSGGGGKRVNPTAGGAEVHGVFGQIQANQTVATGDYADTVLITLTING